MNVGGTLFFQANEGTNGFELWKLLTACTVMCNAKANTLTGPSGADVICGKGGNDTH
jgi:hypothetical protein